jgi:hypothetical protein
MNIKSSLLALAALALGQLSASAAFDLGAAGRTPYDRFMTPVKQVLGSIESDKAPMERAQQLMRVGRAFRYSYTDPYNPALPSVTASTRAGDCKAKSLWLCDQLGDSSVRFVIGKAKRSRRSATPGWCGSTKAAGGSSTARTPTSQSLPIASQATNTSPFTPTIAPVPTATPQRAT